MNVALQYLAILAFLQFANLSGVQVTRSCSLPSSHAFSITGHVAFNLDRCHFKRYIGIPTKLHRETPEK